MTSLPTRFAAFSLLLAGLALSACQQTGTAPPASATRGDMNSAGGIGNNAP